jgi:hypothetical protein
MLTVAFIVMLGVVKALWHIVVDLALFERMLLSQISRVLLETTLILIDSHTLLSYLLASLRNT